MNQTCLACLAAAALTAVSAHGQGTFQDLGFESARVILITNTQYPPYIAVTNALPNWSAFSSSTQSLSTIPYNPTNGNILYSVALFGSNTYVLSGDFSLAIDAGSISQTGLVPTNAESLLFEASLTGGLLVSLNGQDLSYTVVSNLVNAGGLKYSIYGADISAFAGSTETLTFSGTQLFLDGVQFSSSPVPEPGGPGLLALGSGVWIYLRVRKRC